MNTEGLARIHPDFLEVDKVYRFSSKSLRGQADVRVLKKTVDEPACFILEVIDGGFAPQLRKRVGKGDLLTVTQDSGVFYEATDNG